MPGFQPVCNRKELATCRLWHAFPAEGGNRHPAGCRKHRLGIAIPPCVYLNVASSRKNYRGIPPMSLEKSNHNIYGTALDGTSEVLQEYGLKYDAGRGMTRRKGPWHTGITGTSIYHLTNPCANVIARVFHGNIAFSICLEIDIFRCHWDYPYTLINSVRTKTVLFPNFCVKRKF